MAAHHDVLDLDVLRELREMLGAGLTPVLTQFGTQAQELLRTMEEQVQRGDLPAVRASAHRLKGSAGSVGAQRLAAEASSLERGAADGNLDGVRDQLARLPALIAQTIDALRS